jgi:hypothetical protein
VILRPAGQSLGRGGKLTHSGLGTWRDANRCLVPGEGNYPLPLVLVEDVVRAFLLAMDAPGVEGQTFNLVAMCSQLGRDDTAYPGEVPA